MIIADEYQRKTLAKILSEGYKDENPRPHYEECLASSEQKWFLKKKDNMETVFIKESNGVFKEIPLKNGQTIKEERGSCILCTPAHTISINHNVQTYDLAKGEYPIQTLRPQAWKDAIREICWIYQMQSNRLSDIQAMGIKYWNSWDIGDGTIGCRYGGTVKRHDLMNKLLKGLERDPFGRRHILNLWQEDDFDDATGGTTKGLNPCCYETIWNVGKDENGAIRLNMLMNQRSSDYIVSNSINEIQYVALLLMVAKHLGVEPGRFTHISENVQIYDRHISQAKELLQRESVPCNPKLVLDVPNKTNFYDIRLEDFHMEDFPIQKIKEQNPQQQYELGI